MCGALEFSISSHHNSQYCIYTQIRKLYKSEAYNVLTSANICEYKIYLSIDAIIIQKIKSFLLELNYLFVHSNNNYNYLDFVILLVKITLQLHHVAHIWLLFNIFGRHLNWLCKYLHNNMSSLIIIAIVGHNNVGQFDRYQKNIKESTITVVWP